MPFSPLHVQDEDLNRVQQNVAPPIAEIERRLGALERALAAVLGPLAADARAAIIKQLQAGAL